MTSNSSGRAASAAGAAPTSAGSRVGAGQRSGSVGLRHVRRRPAGHGLDVEGHRFERRGRPAASSKGARAMASATRTPADSSSIGRVAR